MKKKWNYLTAIAFLALIAMFSILAVIIKTYHDLSVLQKHYTLEQSDTDYRYHCAFISESTSDDFWDSVYSSAKEAGAKQAIYVERFGENLSLPYTSDELIRMAIAAHVDAILVEPSGNFSTTYLINTAVEQGIAVGTLYRDQLNSNRYNYTGVNSVSLGYDYGKLALSYCSEEVPSVIVLFDEKENSSERRLLLSGIGRAFSDADHDIRLDTRLIQEENSFDAEENIRQFLKDNHDSADIIICTTLLQTQYVSQIAIDMNYVGNFTIIGFYQNASVLEALKNNVISANLVIDTSQIGETAIKNLAEQLEYGHCSDYSQVDSYVIAAKDAQRLLKDLELNPEKEEN